MRIAFDHQIFAAQHHGGISRYFARIAGAMAARGEDARIIAPLHINAYLGDLPRGVVSGRRVAETRWGGRAARVVGGCLAPPLTAAFRPDIVHETYYGARARGPGRRVLTVYDMIHEKFPASFEAGDTTAADKRAAVGRADHVLCISANTRADLIALIPEAAGKSSVTLLGFDALPVGAAPAVGRPYLLFVGQRGGYKNFAGLLDAYAASPGLRADYDLVAVGGGAFSALESAAIARHGVSAQVRQTAADDSALAGWYAGAAVFVYPSLYEGFGIPPLEAMAAGVPVVAMRASSIPEVCGDAAAYSDPGDPASLGSAIDRALGDRDGLRTLGTARLAQFSWENCAAATLAAYRTLL